MISNRTMPSCSVLPELVYEDVDEAIGWLCAAFGFSERWRAPGHRAQLAVGDCAIVVREPRGERAEGATQARDTHSTLVRIEDLQAHHDRASRNGARILKGPAEYPYGERQYTAADLAGHEWTFSESVADRLPEEWDGVTAELD